MPRELTQGQSWHLRSQPNSRAKPGPLPAWALILQGRSPRVKSRPWWFTCPSLSNPHRQKLKDEVSKHVSDVNPESAFRCFFFFFENMDAAEVRESPSQEYRAGSQECSSSPVLAPIPPTGSTDILDRVSPRTHSSSQVLQFL